MNPKSHARMLALDQKYQKLTGLPSLLTNGTVSACIKALNQAGPIHPGRSIKGEIRARFGQAAVQLLEQVFNLKRLDDGHIA